MDAPPDWQDGECCFRCRTQFTLVARKHHCRNCGNIFCAKCSSQQIPLPKLNIEKNVRVCDICYEKISGKIVDPLNAALGSKEKEQKQEQSTKSRSQTNSRSASKSGSSASAPSEQELKEEEELQLALALSLSETPTKVSFPDYRHLEDSQNSVPRKISTVKSNSTTAPEFTDDINTPKLNSTVTGIVSSTSASSIPETSSFQASPGPELSAIQSSVSVSSTNPSAAVKQQATPSQQLPVEYHIQDRDQDLYKFIGEIHGTLEVFNNRLEACKLRNRAVSNDAAIQSLFVKLNSETQPKLAEFIKTYEDEREVYERLHDKLSQITDARAALDALREEHQEKMRQMAAEAERQRQSQLASKLEAMRQKKTQMMQYQRELALQRIREQEMMYQQPQQQQVQRQEIVQENPSITAQIPHQQPTYGNALQQQQVIHAHGQDPSVQPPQLTAGTVQQHWDTNQNVHYSQSYVASIPTSSSTYTTSNHQQQPIVSNSHNYGAYVPRQQVAPVSQAQLQPGIDRAAIAQLEKQFLPEAKPDDEAPLISFDD